MHLPDGFVDLPVAVTTGAVSLGVVAYSVRRTSRELGERTVPLLGVTAAFIFAAQMLNFPVAAGTSGHFLGALLAVALLGPWAATVVMTAVVVVQALVMADGGITALGANVFNMGILPVFVAGGLFYLLKRVFPRSPYGYFVALAVTSWISVVLGSAAVALQLAVSGVSPLQLALPAMVAVHMVIGLGEAVISVAVVSTVLAVRPDLVRSYAFPAKASGDSREALPATSPGPRSRSRVLPFVVGGIVVALALAVFVSPFASASPDGLERVAEDKGFAEAATAPAWDFSPLGDYSFPGLGEGGLSTALAGLVGTLLLFVIVLLAGRAIARSSRAARAGSPLGRSGPLGSDSAR